MCFLLRQVVTCIKKQQCGKLGVTACQTVVVGVGHWLEGAEQPFIVWTDHKTLECFQTSWCFNSKQARWALLFNRLNIILSYPPGSKHGKPDALSRQFDKEETPRTEPILPAVHIMGTVMWDIKKQVKDAHGQFPSPSTCSDNKLNVLDHVRSQVLQWGHSSKLVYHPRVRQFWWTRTSKNLCWLAPPAPSIRHPIKLKQGYCILFLFHIDPDPTSPRISSPVCLLLKIKPLYSPLLTGCSLCFSPKSPLSQRDCRNHVGTGFQGSWFTPGHWVFCKLISASVGLSLGFHTLSNGQTEQFNQEMETARFPPLFPEQEAEASVPSGQAFIHQ